MKSVSLIILVLIVSGFQVGSSLANDSSTETRSGKGQVRSRLSRQEEASLHQEAIREHEHHTGMPMKGHNVHRRLRDSVAVMPTTTEAPSSSFKFFGQTVDLGHGAGVAGDPETQVEQDVTQSPEIVPLERSSRSIDFMENSADTNDVDSNFETSQNPVNMAELNFLMKLLEPDEPPKSSFQFSPFQLY